MQFKRNLIKNTLTVLSVFLSLTQAANNLSQGYNIDKELEEKLNACLQNLTELEVASREFEIMKSIFSQGSDLQKVVENAEQIVENAEKAVENAKAKIPDLQEGFMLVLREVEDVVRSLYTVKRVAFQYLSPEKAADAVKRTTNRLKTAIDDVLTKVKLKLCFETQLKAAEEKAADARKRYSEIIAQQCSKKVPGNTGNVEWSLLEAEWIAAEDKVKDLEKNQKDEEKKLKCAIDIAIAAQQEAIAAQAKADDIKKAAASQQASIETALKNSQQAVLEAQAKASITKKEWDDAKELHKKQHLKSHKQQSIKPMLQRTVLLLKQKPL